MLLDKKDVLWCLMKFATHRSKSYGSGTLCKEDGKNVHLLLHAAGLMPEVDN
jgi:hypothetical protein